MRNYRIKIATNLQYGVWQLLDDNDFIMWGTANSYSTVDEGLCHDGPVRRGACIL